MQVYVYRALFYVSKWWRATKESTTTLEKGYDNMIDYLRERESARARERESASAKRSFGYMQIGLRVYVWVCF